MKHPTPTWYDCVAAVAATLADYGYLDHLNDPPEGDWYAHDDQQPGCWWSVTVYKVGPEPANISITVRQTRRKSVQVDADFSRQGGGLPWKAWGHDETAQQAKARTIEALTLLNTWDNA